MVIVSFVITGACMPKRGSGPISVVARVPSGFVTVVTPSLPVRVTVAWPVPLVTERRIEPSAVRSTR